MTDWRKLPPPDEIRAIPQALPAEWWAEVRAAAEARTAPYRTKITRAMLQQEVD